jgi:hypothetical protein
MPESSGGNRSGLTLQEFKRMKKVFYVPNQPWTVDDVRERADGTLVGDVSGLNFMQIQEKYPGAIITTHDAAISAIEAICRSVPRPIGAHDFYYAKTILKNKGGIVDGHFESFKMEDHLNGRITSIYARAGNEYWKFSDVAEMTHDEIMDRVLHRIGSLQKGAVA